MDDRGSAPILAIAATATVLFGIVAAVGLTGLNAAEEARLAGPAPVDDAAAIILHNLLQTRTVDPEGSSLAGFQAANGSGLDRALLELISTGPAAADGLLQSDEWAAQLAAHGLGNARVEIKIQGSSGADILLETATGFDTAYIADWIDPGPLLLQPGDPDDVIADARAQLEAALAPGSRAERDAILEMGLAFDDRIALTDDLDILVDLPWPVPDVPLLDYLLSPIVEGDVFLADRVVLEEALIDTLDEYELLVVGSGVKQNELTPNGIKTPIKDWVLAGGQLMILGSQDSQAQWLQPIMDIHASTFTGPVTVAGAGSYFLSSPNPLAWQSYPDPPNSWDVEGAVLADGDNAVVAIVDAGLGRVFVSSHDLDDVAAVVGQAEAEAYLENAFVYLLGGLPPYASMSFGAGLPTDREVDTASAATHLWDAGFVRLRVDVWAWSA